MAIKIKYCGLKQETEIDLACELGVDAIGLVFVTKSPRSVSVARAQELSQHLKQSTTDHKPQLVALFVNPDQAFVQQVIDDVKPDVLQFHGQETPEFCEQFNHKYWKAIAMLDDKPWQQQVNDHHAAEYCLLDAYQTGQLGGSGDAFEWFEFPSDLKARLILAGGLNSDNILQAMQQTQTQYLDVSSGIESTRGVKSPALMKQLIQLVNPL